MVRSASHKPSCRPGHAVVAGGGIAGLLAAAALAAFFDRVTIVERDEPAGADARRGVPQGRHVHALLPRGLAALERLLPGFAADAVAAGAIAGNAASEVSWGLGGARLAATTDRLPVISATRPLLESEMRRRVSALSNVGFVTGARVGDFVLDSGSVAGVVVERAGAAERLDAELVVDATGRASRLPAWLREHGFDAPVEEVMAVEVGYASARYKANLERLGGLRAVLISSTPACLRRGVLHVVEQGMIEVSLIGYRGEHPTATAAGLVAHAGSLVLPDIYRLIHDAEPCSDIAVFRVAQTVRRRYEKLKRVPPGIIAVGDAVCAFNPVFAQGMAVAALEALCLQDALRRAGAGPFGAELTRAFYRGAARLLAPAWRMARGNDLVLPHLAHHATLPDRLMARWIRRVLRAGARDPEVARRFIRVASLIDPPPSLLAPRVVLRVLFGQAARKRREAHAGTA